MSAVAQPCLVPTKSPLDEAIKVVVAALKDIEAPRIAVSGGSAGALVGALREALGPRWAQVRLTWADERAVSFDDEASNRGVLYRSGALSAADPPRQELSLFGPGETLESAAERASSVFSADFGGLDVAILGMGGDAHIASHFPGSGAPAEGNGAVQMVRDSPKPPSQRLTLSLPVLASAGLCLIYALGEGKRDAIEATLAGKAEVPAVALERLVIVTDQTGLGI